MIVLLSCLLAKSAPAGCMQGAGISDDSKKTKRDSGQQLAGMTIMICLVSSCLLAVGRHLS